MMACKVEGCGRGGKLRRGWCEMHYKRWQTHGDPMATRHRPHGMKLAQFCEWARRERTAPNYGCERWTGQKGPRGYGRTTFGGGDRRVHRLIAEHYHGPAPDGRPQVNHICNDPSCINPAHVYWGTAGDNARDRETAKRGRWSGRPARVCDVDDCGGKHLARGLCNKHYRALVRARQVNEGEGR